MSRAFSILVVLLIALPVAALAPGSPLALGRPGAPPPIAPSRGSDLLAQARASLHPAGAAPVSVPGPTYCATDHPSQYPELNPHQWARNARCAYAAARAQAAGGAWVSDSPDPPPFYLDDFVMTYDSTDRYVLLFGDPDVGSPTAPSETWEYVGGRWTQLDPSVAPVSCLSSAIADDPTDGEVVYLAGTSSANLSTCPDAGTTWTFHAGTWTELHPTGAPSARSSASFTNDTADGYLLLFGGVSSSCPGTGNVCGDTWTFSAGTWTELHPSVAPSNRSSAGMTYDAADGYVLLFGGEGADGSIYTMFNDTWSFSAGGWTQIPTNATPPEPWPDGLAYDYADGYAIYTQVCGNLTNDYRSEVTWAYAGGTWKALSGSCSYGQGVPPQRLGEGTTFDGADGYFLFFGGGGIYFVTGSSQELPNLDDSWSYARGTWTNRTLAVYLPTDGGAAAAYDAADREILVAGGYNGTGTPTVQTEIFANGSWGAVDGGSPWLRIDPGMVYDASDGYVLLFGGWDPTTDQALNDTWEYFAGQWTELYPTSAPSPRAAMGMVYDGATGDVVLFGGGAYPDTWTYHAGVWTNVTAQAGTGPGLGYPDNPLAYDAADGYVLMFGTAVSTGSNGVTYTNDTWAYASGTWVNLTGSIVGAPPSPRVGAAMSGVGASGGVVLFAGACVPCGESTDLDDTWTYENLTWTLQPAGLSPVGREYATMVDDGALGAVVMFGGSNETYSDTGILGRLSDTWYWEPGAGPSPSLRSFVAQPAQVDVNASTNLTVDALGGTLPLNYAYNGLPPGCPSADVATLGCTPNRSGTYPVVVQVTDALGNRTSAGLTLVVVPSPRITAFTATPSPVGIENRTVLDVALANGTSPVVFAYGGLPPGCTGQTVPALPCAPTTAGNYTVDVRVTDAFGESAHASVGLTVVAAGASGAPSITSFAAVPSSLVLGNETNLTVQVPGTASPSVAYSGLPPGCATANTTPLACTPTAAGSYTINVTVNSTSGGSTTVGTGLVVYPVSAGGGLAITGFSPSLRTVPAGGSDPLHLTAEGGTFPLTYAYANLPGGCVSQDAATLPCVPESSGDFRVIGTVVDGAGHRASVPLELTVLPAAGSGNGSLAIAAFAAEPSSIPLGGTTQLVSDVLGATGAVRYAYAFLPPGCSDRDAADLTCAPNASGTYAVQLTITDASGNAARATATLVVGAGGATSTVPPPLGPSALVLAGVAVASALAAAGVGGFFLGRRRTGAGGGPGGPPA